MKRLDKKAIGERVYLLENGINWESYIVIAHDSPSVAYEGFENRVTLLRERTLASPVTATFFDAGNYTNTDFHPWLNGELLVGGIANGFLLRLGEDVRGLITPVRIPFRAGSGAETTVNSGVNGLLTRAFALSAREVGIANGLAGVSGALPEDEGVTFPYFLEGDEAGPARVRRQAMAANGSGVSWRLRTPTIGTSTLWGINADGSAAAGLWGWFVGITVEARPAITLPSNTQVDVDGRIDGTVFDEGSGGGNEEDTEDPKEPPEKPLQTFRVSSFTTDITISKRIVFNADGSITETIVG